MRNQLVLCITGILRSVVTFHQLILCVAGTLRSVVTFFIPGRPDRIGYLRYNHLKDSTTETVCQEW